MTQFKGYKRLAEKDYSILAGWSMPRWLIEEVKQTSHTKGKPASLWVREKIIQALEAEKSIDQKRTPLSS